MKSDGDGSMQYGAIMKKQEARRRLRRLQERGLGESSAAAALKFSVEVTSHDSRGLVMEMNFADPNSISSGNQNDAVEMKVLEVSLF